MLRIKLHELMRCRFFFCCTAFTFHPTLLTASLYFWMASYGFGLNCIRHLQCRPPCGYHNFAVSGPLSYRTCSTSCHVTRQIR